MDLVESSDLVESTPFIDSTENFCVKGNMPLLCPLDQIGDAEEPISHHPFFSPGQQWTLLVPQSILLHPLQSIFMQQNLNINRIVSLPYFKLSRGF